MNLIDCTIKMKEEARNHYERLAQAVEESDMKRIFSLLADAEEEHLEILRKMSSHLAVLSNYDWGVDESVCVFRPSMDSGNLGDSLRDDPDGYRHVTQEERETIRFFEDLAENTNDVSMRRLCHALSLQERNHLIKIENIYSFVEDPRTYLEWREFSNIKSI